MNYKTSDKAFKLTKSLRSTTFKKFKSNSLYYIEMSSSHVWKYTTPEETAETKQSVEKSRKIMKNIITDKIDRREY